MEREEFKGLQTQTKPFKKVNSRVDGPKEGKPFRPRGEKIETLRVEGRPNFEVRRGIGKLN
jgi:hypothetical protein